MREIFTSFARNTVFANILLLFIFLGGVFALNKMPREIFPDVELDMVRVSVAFPGADPEEVEEGVSRKIEEALEGIDGIKDYHTISNEHLSVALVEIREGYNVRMVKEKIRNAVDAITTFPVDAERPIIEQFIVRISVMRISITSPYMTDEELRQYAESVRDELRALPEVTRVTLMYARPYEIAVEVSEERMREFGITFDQVAQVVRANSLNLPGGTIRTEREEIRLRTVGKNYTGEDFAKIIVTALPDGRKITLDQIATIKDGLAEQTTKMRFNGKKAVTLQIQKTKEEDTLKIDRAVLKYVEMKKKDLPEGIEMTVWSRNAPRLQDRIRLLVRNGIMGLIVVFAMLWLFLDIRLSFWAGMGMPVSILGAFVVMAYFGATINMMSLFAMITVLGIIVDDAIVVGEAIYTARRNGMPALKAAVEGVMEVGLPVIGAVTTTIVAFVPLFFVSGVMGRIISVVPLVVIAALSVSLLECLFLLPAHLSHLPNPNMQRKGKGIFKRLGLWFHQTTNLGLERFVEKYYVPVIDWALRHRYISLSIALCVLFLTKGVMDAGFLKFENFPKLDGDTMTAVIEFPSGTPVTITEDAVAQIEEAARQMAAEVKTKSGDPLIETMFAMIGSRLDQRGGIQGGSHLGTVRLGLLATTKRDIHVNELMALWEKKIGKITGVVGLTLSTDDGGPSSLPIEIWLQGNNLDSLIASSEEIKKKLGEFEGVFQIQDDNRMGYNEIQLKLKPEARALGFTVADLARQINAGYQGQETLRVQRGKNEIRVRVRYPEEERKNLDFLENMRVRPMLASAFPSSMTGLGKAALSGMTALGGGMPGASRPTEVPLSAVADVSFENGPAAIRRTNGQRRLVVTADVNSAVANANQIVRHINETFFPELQARYRDVEMAFRGDWQDYREAIDSLYISFPLAIIGIFIIIATIFRSYIQPLVILVTVPFGMSGAIFGHLLLGYDLSMLSVFGLVALAGIVVNDAIVLIECVNTYVAQGEYFYQAVLRGGVRRFRPIFLTTITTVGGLGPIILERDRQAQPLIPMAISIAAGLTFATLLTLLLIPCLLYILNDIRRCIHFVRTGIVPSPEEVEPARLRSAGDTN